VFFFQRKQKIFVRGQNGEILFFPLETKKTNIFAKTFTVKCQNSKPRKGPSSSSALLLSKSMVVYIVL